MTNKGHRPSQLISAIRNAQLSGVVNALNEGADIEEADVHGHGGLPLRTACFEGNLAIVRELLMHGANPNAIASDGTGAPLRLALRRGHGDIVALLLHHGATPSADLAIPSGMQEIQTEPLAVEAITPSLPEMSIDNLIEFTPSNFKSSQAAMAPSESAENFGTETNALSTDLLFLDDDEVPAISWQQPTKSN